MGAMDPTRLFNLPGLARRLRVPNTWLRAEADAGRIPCIRAGSRYLFDIAAVEAALLERAAATPEPRPARKEAADAAPRK